ncbi:hypothetical protein RvY_14446 [Ramazzottius varieornatus]|uniref:Uncharacterized protein n=1 Tax=Ramazzottius varieornatus TaxID=947166 RepID=A0A1D1VZS1_RAMVA|nr:hypothetical protein RvY_14446 [Ramazzottius varieornatus]
MDRGARSALSDGKTITGLQEQVDHKGTLYMSTTYWTDVSTSSKVELADEARGSFANVEK